MAAALCHPRGGVRSQKSSIQADLGTVTSRLSHSCVGVKPRTVLSTRSLRSSGSGGRMGQGGGLQVSRNGASAARP